MSDIERLRKNCNDYETDSESLHSDNENGSNHLLNDGNVPPVMVDRTASCRRAFKNTFLSTNMTDLQQKEIFQMLRDEPFLLKYLPKVPRTVVNTPSIVERNLVQNLCGRRYIYFNSESLIKEY